MISDPQFWVAIAFIAFIAAVFNPVKKILTKNLDTQIKQIKDKIEDAENIKNETQVTLSEIKKRQNDIQNEIESINNDANNKLKQFELDAEKKLQDQIEKRKNSASAKIDQLTRDANSAIQSYITSSAIEATIDLLHQKLNDQEKQKLIDSSITELGSVIKN